MEVQEVEVNKREVQEPEVQEPEDAITVRMKLKVKLRMILAGMIQAIAGMKLRIRYVFVGYKVRKFIAACCSCSFILIPKYIFSILCSFFSFSSFFFFLFNSFLTFNIFL